MKKVTIEVPDDMDFDPDKFDYELVKKEKKSLCYDDIARKLFYNGFYYIDGDGDVQCGVNNCCISDPNNCTSKKQGRKLLALNKLLNVAHFLNDGWRPTFNHATQNYYLVCVHESSIYSTVRVDYTTVHNSRLVYFKSRELAKQAFEILGEGTIELALSTDW